MAASGSSGNRRRAAPSQSPNCECATSSRARSARRRTLRPQQRRAARAASALAPSPSELRPSLAAALAESGASARAAETTSSRCPVRHCATRLDFRHALKRFARLRIRHVMQQRDGAIELDLRRPRARYGEVDGSQRWLTCATRNTAANAATKMTRNKILLLSESAGAERCAAGRARSSTVNGLVRPRSRY